MLKDKAVAATLAVTDLDRARGFYEQTLGLELAEEIRLLSPTGQACRSCSSTPPGTPARTRRPARRGGIGDDFDAVVQDLRQKGVTFEHYGLPDTTREGDIHVMGGMRAVWLKDPDGNILSLVNQAM